MQVITGACWVEEKQKLVESIQWQGCADQLQVILYVLE